MTRKIFLVLSLLLISESDALAACTPPSDYTGCSAAQFGPKIAGNTNPKNYKQIRDAYNQNPAYSDKLIPVTVIYTTADLNNPTFLQSNLQAMKDNGLLPIIRVSSPVIGSSGNWDPINPTSAQSGAQNLNNALSQIGYGQNVIVYFGNEPNLPTEWGGSPNASEFANALSAFIQGAGNNRNFQLYLPPFALESGSEDAFAKMLLSDPRIKGKIDGIAITAYGPTSEKLKALIERQKAYLSSLDPNLTGVFISEIGPLINGKLLINPSQKAQFEQFLRDVVYKQLGLYLTAGQFMTTSFFADTNGDGNVDATFLIIVDANGNIIVVNLSDYSGSITAYPLVRTVDGSNEVSIAYSDPVKLTQTAKINTTTGPKTYTRGGFFEQFEDNTIPFVKKTLEYLAGPFVSELGDKEKIRQLVNNPRLEEAGVYSRLAPLYIQNKLRTQFRENCVKRIYTENECFILDPDNKELVDITDINPPPTLDTSPDYTKWSKEKNNALRWYSIPLFANPDTLVKRAVYMNACPPGIADAQKETTADSRVPLVSSLKDVSTELNKMLIPQGASSGVANKAQARFDSPEVAQQNNPAGPADTAIERYNSGIIAGPVLAQNPPPAPQDDSNFNPFVIGFTPEISQIELTKYNVCWTINPRTQDANYDWCDWGYRINVSVNDKLAASFEEPLLAGHCFRWNPSLTCNMGTAHSLIVSAEKPEDIKVGLQITRGACTGPKCKTIDFRTRFGTSAGPGQPSCILPSVGGKNPGSDENPVLITGHALLREPHKDLSCKKWENPGTINEKCADGDTEFKVEDPVWAEIKYPFLSTIHGFLAGKTGVFNIFRPPEKERDKWYEPAESKISYCLTDHPATSMIKSGSLEVYNKNFDKAPARCDNNTATKTLSAYPPLLGGIDNAREWIFNMFKTSKTTPTGSQNNNPAQEASRIQTAIDAVKSTLTKDKAKSIKKGDAVGLMGNTGYSSGPHLHFAVYNYKLGDAFAVNQNLLDPCQFLTCDLKNNSITNGTYQVPIQSPQVTQWYGGQNHRGIDLFNAGNPTITAAEDGDMFLITGGQTLGNGVIIYHSDGKMSLYWHLQ